MRGNEIRSIIRNANGKSILWSTMFDVYFEFKFCYYFQVKDLDMELGFASGVQYHYHEKVGTITEILDHYYPGTITREN